MRTRCLLGGLCRDAGRRQDESLILADAGQDSRSGSRQHSPEHPQPLEVSHSTVLCKRLMQVRRQEISQHAAPPGLEDNLHVAVHLPERICLRITLTGLPLLRPPFGPENRQPRGLVGCCVTSYTTRVDSTCSLPARLPLRHGESSRETRGLGPAHICHRCPAARQEQQ